MKTKLKIDLLNKFSDSDNLSKIIASHNGGDNPASLSDINSWLWCLRSIFDINKGKDVHGEFDNEDEPTKLLIKEGEKVVAVIEEIEIHELQEEETNLSVG